MIDISPKPPAAPVYLGDAVYASYDGYQVWLHLNDHKSMGVIALNDQVMEMLNLYHKRVTGQ
jgi:hypothetical protein